MKVPVVPIVDENEVEALQLPGRRLRWLVTKDNVNAAHCSMCMIQIAPGETVKPAHSHPNGEEAIYIISGSGKVMVDGKVEPVKAGCAVLFPQGKAGFVRQVVYRRRDAVVRESTVVAVADKGVG